MVGGWGGGMSNDPGLAVGMLALVGGRAPDRLSTSLLTFAIVDDVAGIVIIALAYSGHIDLTALVIGFGILAVVVVARARGLRSGAAYLVLGVAAWIGFF